MANNVGIAFDQVLQNAVQANATGGTMNVGGLPGVGMQVTGVFTATVTPKASIDGNYLTVQAYNLGTGAWVTTIMVAGLYWVPLPGVDQFQAPITNWASGPVTVTVKGMDAPPGMAPALTTKQAVQLTDGTTSQPMASAATLSAANSGEGAAIGTTPGEWAVTHAPAVNTQATISKAAGGSGVRHVCRWLTCTLANDATGTAQANVLFNLRDGATGAGTILASFTLALPATPGECRVLGLSGLNIFGSANTAMTLEAASAPALHTAASVALGGYDVN